MRCELVQAAGEPPVRVAGRLRALVPTGQAVREQVAEIIAEVRAAGDEALRAYTRRFDTGGTEPLPFRVPAADVDSAVNGLAAEVREALESAIDNVGTVARAAVREDVTVRLEAGHE